MPLMRLRMYGSTETKTLRTSTSPSPGATSAPRELEVGLSRLTLRARREHDLAHHATGTSGMNPSSASSSRASSSERSSGGMIASDGREVLVGQLLAASRTASASACRPVPQRTLVAVADRPRDLPVELVQPSRSARRRRETAPRRATGRSRLARLRAPSADRRPGRARPSSWRARRRPGRSARSATADGRCRRPRR